MTGAKSIAYATFGISSGLVVPGALLTPPLATGTLSPAEQARFELREMSSLAVAGRRVYYGQCAVCHGDDAMGTATAPSLHNARFRKSQSGRQDFHQETLTGKQHRQFPQIRRLSFNQIEQIARYMKELRAIGS